MEICVAIEKLPCGYLSSIVIYLIFGWINARMVIFNNLSSQCSSLVMTPDVNMKPKII